jgi:hypothetical protein
VTSHKAEHAEKHNKLMGGRYMTVEDTARIAIVLKKLDEARLRLFEATKIYEHVLEGNSEPIHYGTCSVEEPQCDD